MTLFLDPGVLHAALDLRDPNHKHARDLLAEAVHGERGRVLTSTFVLDEAFTLLRAKRLPVRAVERLKDLAWPSRAPFLDIVEVTADEVQEATGLFIEHHARGLSLTDCTSLLLARRHRAALATYDGGFAGLIACVPAS